MLIKIYLYIKNINGNKWDRKLSQFNVSELFEQHFDPSFPFRNY
jgi:hypothetical protein